MRNKTKTFLILAGIILLGFLLRIIGLDKPDGFWYDEAITYYSASLNSIFEVVKSTVHGPLYFTLLHFWIKFIGESDLVIRLFSVLTGVLTIPIMYLAGKELKNSNLGLIAATLTGINSLFIYYSQEVRFYPLLIFLVAINALFLIKSAKKPDCKNFTCLGISMLLVISTYVLSFLFVFFEIIALWIYIYFEKKDFLKIFYKFLMSLTLVGLIFTFFALNNFISTFMGIGKYYRNTFDVFPFDLSVLFMIFQNWTTPQIIGLTNNITGYVEKLFLNTPINELAVFVLFPMGIQLITFLKGILEKKKLTIIHILAITIIGFLGVEIIATLLNKFSIVTRYTLVCVPFFILICSYGLFIMKKTRILMTYLVLTSIFYIITVPYSAPKMQRPEGQKLGAALLNKYPLNEKDIVLLPLVPYQLDKHFKKKSKRISLESTFINDKKGLASIIGNENAQILNAKTSYDVFKNYLSSKYAPKSLEKFLQKKYYNNLENGRYFIIVENKSFNIYSKRDLNFVTNSVEYEKQSIIFMLLSKLTFDIVDISYDNLIPVSIDNNGPWVIYIFKKDN
ncbi:MAG: glycosyltransferase family 39 protein [Candidatus Gastranaerophilales bacterium]|nr:glycosyltransferase family 39 protein [Candidatus Gastranaerophilales bacterium]